MQRYLLTALTVGLTACATTQPSEAPPPADGVMTGETTNSVKQAAQNLPDFTLETIHGEEFTLSEHVGREVIVMSFWATWCQPCMAELPHLDAMYQELESQGLLIVAVSMDEPSTQAEVAPTAARLGLTMPVVLDTNQRAVALYNRSRNAPMTVVIDKKGRVVRATAGYNPGDEEQLEKELRDLLTQ